MQENENKANMKKDNLSTDNNNISSNKGNIPRSSYINMDQTNNILLGDTLSHPEKSRERWDTVFKSELLDQTNKK